ncbi:MAG: tripartite tricarboxylate transporter substrate binding protein [Betaproteobacteria bacterium]|nr:tripartite tricarboxylate transporter substrate binding protein [Betaproteobacteria bacterium]
MNLINRRVAVAAIASCAALHAANVWAQDLADRPIRLVVPFAAGGGVDVLARALAGELSKAIQRSVAVENRPSATGQIGAAEVAKAPPDGTTLLISSAAFGITPSFVHKLPYDILKDFESITIVASTPQVLVAPVGFKANTFAEAMQMARSGTSINFPLPGSSGIQRLATELLTATAQINVNKVPYKGAGAAFTDLIAGRVDLMFDNPGSSMVHVRSGRLKVLATTGLTRLSTLPDVPAVAETLSGFEALNWFILTAPAGTPSALLDRLNTGVAQAMRTDAMRQVLERDGLNAVASSRAQASAFLRSEFAKWDKIIKERNLTAE